MKNLNNNMEEIYEKKIAKDKNAPSQEIVT